VGLGREEKKKKLPCKKRKKNYRVGLGREGGESAPIATRNAKFCKTPFRIEIIHHAPQNRQARLAIIRLCVCVCERERERESVCVCDVCVCMYRPPICVHVYVYVTYKAHRPAPDLEVPAEAEYECSKARVAATSCAYIRHTYKAHI